MKQQLLIINLLLSAVTLSAQDTINRQVTVEREFQPILEQAQKIKVAPTRVDLTIEPAEVTYSTYAEPLPRLAKIHPLACSEVRYQAPEPENGHIDGAICHRNTHIDFLYTLWEKKDIVMDLYARHDGQWGRSTLEKSVLGMTFCKSFSPLDVYFTVDGQNRYYSRYGRYYDGDNGLTIDKISDLQPADWQTLWDVHTNFGIRSAKGQAVQYGIETGYNTTIVPSQVAEHRVMTHAYVGWQGDEHSAGLEVRVQNAFMTLDKDSAPIGAYDTYRNRHGIRMRPYYAYEGYKVRVRVGMNLDMNIGRGQFLTNAADLSFAPSPDVHFEYRIVPSWLLLYANAIGSFGYGTLDGYYDSNLYLGVRDGIISQHVCGYVPVDAGLGFRIKPCEGLLLDVHARYAYRMNQLVWKTELPNMSYFYSDWQQWTVGAEVTYHYRDIIHILASGHYYKWIQQSLESPLSRTGVEVYDRPSWDAHLRIDANIDRKWSLYSDNIFAGSRMAMTATEDIKLKPTIDLSLGVRYAVNRWLTCYLQVNNYLNRHNDIYYGYQSQGVHGLLGVKYSF